MIDYSKYNKLDSSDLFLKYISLGGEANEESFSKWLDEARICQDGTELEYYKGNFYDYNEINGDYR